MVRRLAGLFAVDAAGGGLVTTGFLSYYLAERYHVSVAALGWLFFAVSVVQAVSVALAPLLARRFGLVATMVGTHLPSNVLLAAVAFAPTFGVAAVLLLARTTLSQMDVPTRQALVMTVVTPAERTAAAAVTNASRYTVRPVGPLVAGLVQQLALGAPLVSPARSKPDTTWPCGAGRTASAWPPAPARHGPAPPPYLPLPPHRGSRHDRLPAHRLRPARMAGPVPGLDRRRARRPPAARHPRRACLRARRPGR